jgi:isoquinoline 1-oxidoreductase
MLHPAAPAFRLLPATWTACAAPVEVNPASGEFKVNKPSLAMDLGTVVNPDGVRAQIEGSALCGMSLAASTSASSPTTSRHRAAAIANAIYNAVGARVRSLPITAEAVKAAMKA